jgi:hypothetical protein
VGAYVFIGLLVVVVFAADAGLRCWRQNSWQYRRRDDEDDDAGMPTA